jgi:hypothetical protein
VFPPDAFARREPYAAKTILDIFTDQSRGGLIVGHRMFVLVQTNDPDLAYPSLGRQGARWNRLEWMDASRHPDRGRR